MIADNSEADKIESVVDDDFHSINNDVNINQGYLIETNNEDATENVKEMLFLAQQFRMLLMYENNRKEQ